MVNLCFAMVEVVGIEPTSKESSVKRTTCVALNYCLKAKTISACLQENSPVIFSVGFLATQRLKFYMLQHHICHTLCYRL